MEIYQFVSQYPLPAPIRKGESKRQLTITLSEREYDLLGYLAHHPHLKAMYEGNLYSVVRHAFAAYAWDLKDLVDGGWQPIINQIRRLTEQASWKPSREKLFELLDETADRLNTLLDFGQVDGALSEYHQMHTDMAEFPAFWLRVFITLRDNHQELQHFRQRIVKAGLSQEIQVIEETAVTT